MGFRVCVCVEKRRREFSVVDNEWVECSSGWKLEREQQSVYERSTRERRNG